jgi:hypothetical protein
MKIKSRGFLATVLKPETVIEKALVISVYTVVVIIATVFFTDKPQFIPEDEANAKVTRENKILSDENKELRMQNADLISEMAELSKPKTTSSQQMPENQSPSEKPYSPTAKNIEMSDIGSSIIDYKDGSEYMDVSYRVKLKNNNNSIVGVRVTFTLEDKNGYLLRDHIIFEPVFLDPGETKIVSDKDFLKKSIYKNTEKIGAEIKLR